MKPFYWPAEVFRKVRSHSRTYNCEISGWLQLWGTTGSLSTHLLASTCASRYIRLALVFQLSFLFFQPTWWAAFLATSRSLMIVGGSNPPSVTCYCQKVYIMAKFADSSKIGTRYCQRVKLDKHQLNEYTVSERAYGLPIKIPAYLYPSRGRLQT